MINSLKYNDKYIVFFNFEKNTTNVNFYMHTCNQFEKKLSCKIKMYNIYICHNILPVIIFYHSYSSSLSISLSISLSMAAQSQSGSLALNIGLTTI